MTGFQCNNNLLTDCASVSAEGKRQFASEKKVREATIVGDVPPVELQ